MDAIIAKAKKIKLLILDVDGVLTDGTIFIDDHGVQQLGFNIQDGLGIKLLQKTGVKVALITGRSSNVVKIRAQLLGIHHVYQGNTNKRLAYQELLQKLQLSHEQVAYVGDDLPDLALLQQAGFSITVANAREYLKQQTHWQTTARGGQGAVREVCELIMQAQGTWQSILGEFNA